VFVFVFECECGICWNCNFVGYGHFFWVLSFLLDLFLDFWVFGFRSVLDLDRQNTGWMNRA